MSRILVIGDFHGGLKALIQVLERAKVEPSDHLIFLGDLVDGWSDSANVIRFLLGLERTHQCTFIRGNHDVSCCEWLVQKMPGPMWLHHGGDVTMKSYAGITDEERRDHIQFFERMKDYLVDQKGRLFIHAGFTSMHGPEKEVYPSNYTWDRTLWEVARVVHGRVEPEHPDYPARLKHFQEIYIGHTPVTNIGWDVPLQRSNLWNMDTGAGFKGKLSLLDVETKEFWQSDPLPELYPGEKGRNQSAYQEDKDC